MDARRGRIRVGLLLAAVAVALAAMVGLVPAQARAASFPDVDGGAWYTGAVTWASDNDVMSGYAGGTFGPYDPLTREQAAAVFYNYLGGSDRDSAPVTTLRDVIQSEWYAKPVNWAVFSGTMLGYSGTGTFGVGDPLTREQVATIMARVCGADLTSVDTSKYDALPDHASTSTWARPSVAWAVEEGVINGVALSDGTRALWPQVTVNRAQMAAIMMNAVKGGVLKRDEPKPSDDTSSSTNTSTNTNTTPAERTYRVTFDSAGGSSVSTQTVVAGKTATEPKAPTREGYTFAGWYSDSALTRRYDFSAAVNANVTLHAKWTAAEATEEVVPLSEAYITLYDDGEMVFSADGAVDEGRTVLASGRGAELEPDGWWTGEDFSSNEVQSRVYAYFTAGTDLLYQCEFNATRITSRCRIKVTDNELKGSSDSLSKISFDDYHALKNVDGLSYWDVSSVTDLSSFFFSCENLEDISGLASWDVSSVTNMSSLFKGCESLTDFSPIAGWKMSSVSDMTGMFGAAYSPMGSAWNRKAPKVTNLSAFKNWDISKMTDMSNLFSGLTSLTDVSDIADWDMSAVTSMENMFSDCSSLSDISSLSSWDTSSVINMSGMFSGCSSLTSLHGLEGWDTSKVTDMSSAFSWCVSLSDLSAIEGWNTSSVVSMNQMFGDCYSLAELRPLSAWKTPSLKDMSYMFCVWNNNANPSLANLQGLEDWDTSHVESMDYTFYKCSSLKDASAIENWNTSSVKSMVDMFYLTGLTELPSWYKS